MAFTNSVSVDSPRPNDPRNVNPDTSLSAPDKGPDKNSPEQPTCGYLKVTMLPKQSITDFTVGAPMIARVWVDFDRNGTWAQDEEIAVNEVANVIERFTGASDGAGFLINYQAPIDRTYDVNVECDGKSVYKTSFTQDSYSGWLAGGMTLIR